MTTQQKHGGRTASLPTGLAVGAAVSIGVTIMICVVGAILISAELVPQDQIGYCTLTALVAATIFGGLAACGKVQRQKLMVCLLSAAVYYLLLVGVTITFFGGNFQGLGVTGAVVFLGSVATILLATGKKKQGRGARRKKFRR